ncbi:MAG: UDP-N-acetylmuramoyl-L-alanine--D-glutamate ligase [Actinomycetota bacterium]
MIQVLRGVHVLVVGLATSGIAAAQALILEGARVRVSEEGSDPEGAATLRALGVEVLTGGHTPEHLDGIELVVTSPGVPERAPILVWALERGIVVWSELELGSRLTRAAYVAITGTNGKSTTAEMIASMMRADGLDAIACGNIGYPLTAAARETHDALAVEASSFQLRFVDAFSPNVSVLLNVAADHLDWHGTMGAYGDAKARIFEHQRGDDVHVANRGDERAAEISRRATCRLVWFGLDEPGEGDVGYIGEELVSRLDGDVALGTPSLGDDGFREDAAAAAAASLAFGLTPKGVAEGLRRMRPLAHRGETVARPGDIPFIDNSKATNIHATIATLRGRERVVLIAGGMSKGVDLSPLGALGPQLAGVVAIGEAAPQISALFEGVVPVRIAASIEDAVHRAYDLAPPDGTVVLAPACASWDMFTDYAERGNRFTAAARRLEQETLARG